MRIHSSRDPLRAASTWARSSSGNRSDTEAMYPDIQDGCCRCAVCCRTVPPVHGEFGESLVHVFFRPPSAHPQSGSYLPQSKVLVTDEAEAMVGSQGLVALPKEWITTSRVCMIWRQVCFGSPMRPQTLHCAWSRCSVLLSCCEVGNVEVPGVVWAARGALCWEDVSPGTRSGVQFGSQC